MITEMEKYKKDCEELNYQLNLANEKNHELSIEKDELQKRFDEQEKEIAFLRGQVSAFQFCAKQQ